MRKFIFYPIGEIVKLGNISLKVEEANSCQGCEFWNKDIKQCQDIGISRNWNCFSFLREDGKSVIFRRVEKAK